MFLPVQLRTPISPEQLAELFDSLQEQARARGGRLALLLDASTADFAQFGLEHASVARRALAQLAPVLRGRYRAEAFVHERRAVRFMVAANQRLFGLADASRTFASVSEAERWLTP